MNVGSKGKKRPVLPRRPDPPTVDQILEDISQAAPDDPVFSPPDPAGPGPSPPAEGDAEVELRFQQCRRFLELNEKLQEARKRLLQMRGELQEAGEELDKDLEEVQGQMF